MKRKRAAQVEEAAAHTDDHEETAESPPQSPIASESDASEIPDSPVRNADRSARRKNARRIVQHAIADASSDDDADHGGAELEAHMWDDGDAAEEEESGDGAEAALVPETPLKRKRGRPRKDREKEESPPSVNMPPFERYFWDNRTGAGKTSNNVFAPGMLLDHDRFFEERDQYTDGHKQEQKFLVELHESAFEQWTFELKNEFNLCLYGYGSKKELMQSFAGFIHETLQPHPPSIVLVNGYAPNLTLLDILTTIASTLFPAHIKLPSTVATLLSLILETLTKKPPKNALHLLINSIDAPPLRRPIIQSTLATLTAHPSLRLLVTADSPNFPLLWDAPLRSRFRFLFHDCTTFIPLDAEVVDAVDAVATLLGKKSSRIGGKDGVTFVLRSLPENARHLFRILVAEQVAAGIGVADGEDDDAAPATAATAGVEYRVLYHKAREELVCSTEHQLRGLLKEFYDHQMVESRRDALGTERLMVPFKQEELESLLEDLVE
jgi:origin recognition complex subunit 2